MSDFATIREYVKNRLLNCQAELDKLADLDRLFPVAIQARMMELNAILDFLDGIKK